MLLIKLLLLFGLCNAYHGTQVDVVWVNCGVTNTLQCLCKNHIRVLNRIYILNQHLALYSDFYIWTFVYDVSGIDSVMFYYRQDKDEVNPLNDYSNEVYQSG